ncbi:peptidoglycan D,D-transpeptidase FtsI family protein [Weissella kandleri]|uniref:peptidoglycan D,D-transpeptidase FtsI family protein n=1 Tax=Weissella kandleri TaxID=1616 RepID=UPI00387E860C
MQQPRRKRRRRRAPNSLTRIPVRLNALLGIVILILVILGVQLLNLQVRKADKFKAEVNSSAKSIEKENVQRGNIYDSTGKVMVDNKGSQAITYQKPKSITEAEMYKVANEVGKYLQVDTDQLADTNYAMYYIQDDKRAQKVGRHINNLASDGTDAQVRQLTQYLKQHKDDFPLTDAQKNNAMIYQKMGDAYALSTVYLKTNDVSAEEIANIGERQSKMPGVKVGLYYTREYPSGDAMASIIGAVSTSKSGLPESQVNSLLTKGYDRDDSVGTSYLEQYYESALRGTKRKVSVGTDNRTGKTSSKVIQPGQAGSDLTLTVNAKFQEDLQKILEEKIPGGLTEGGYAVMINPKTGALYGMAGVHRDNKTGKMTSDALGNINRAQVVGSVVKPAMITTAMMNNVITPTNSAVNDVPIQIAGTAVKSSWFNQNGSVPLTAETALEASSNSYVMQLMLKMGGLNYYPNMTLGNLDPSVWSKMRNGFARFGLGVPTGIDLPGEVTGIKGKTDAAHSGNALDESFGQYDTFTPIQLAQYVATIANGGYRVQPHVVESISNRQKDSNVEHLQTTIPTKVLGTVGWTDAQRKVIYDGMDRVVHGSGSRVTGSQLKGIKPSVSAKTGTAETFTDGQETFSSTGVSFAKDRDVALAIVVPGISNKDQDSVANTISVAIWEAYWRDVANAGTD